MKQKLQLFILLFAGLFATLQGSAQNNGIVKGKVVSEDGEPVPGLSVIEKGTGYGTATNIDGTYEIKLRNPEGATLQFFGIGYAKQEVEVGNRSVIDITVSDDVTELESVVVTALGQEANKAHLGYTVAAVKSEQLQVAPSTNVAMSLSGKIPGVQVLGASAGKFDANVVVRLRGATGLNSDEGALWILDGVRVNPRAVNPDDVESVSVLKGAAASVLYGEEAANGVIIVTSKGGEKGRIRVDVSSTMTLNKAVLPFKMQDKFGGGWNLDFNTFEYDESKHPEAWKAMDGKPMAQWGDGSWGPELNGQEVLQWDSFYEDEGNYLQTRPWKASDEGIPGFFDTGITSINSVSVSGGSDDVQFRMGYGYLDENGIMPGTEKQRHTVNFRTTANLADRLTATAMVNYASEYFKGNFEERYGLVGSSLYQWNQVQLDYDRLSNYKTPEGMPKTWNFGNGAFDKNSPNFLLPEFWNSPFWDAMENYREDHVQRLSGNIGLTYSITDNWDISVNASTYVYERDRSWRVKDNTYRNGKMDFAPWYSKQKRSDKNTFLSFLSTYNDKFGDFSIDAKVGGERRDYRRSTLEASTSGFLAPGFYNVRNSAEKPELDEYYRNRGVRSLYGSARVGFKEMLFVEFTGRNDWSSTLPEDRNSAFYPGVNGSFVFSELLKSSWITSGNLKAAWAQVKKAIPPYQLSQTYGVGATWGSTPTMFISGDLPNNTLEAQEIVEYELGGQLAVLNDRLGVDITYFNRTSTNEFLPLDVPGTSGFSSLLINAGEFRSWGWEVALRGSPIRTDDFKWDINVSFAPIKTEVVSLFTDPISGRVVERANNDAFEGDFPYVYNDVGKPWGTLVVSQGYKRDESGRVVYSGSDGNYSPIIEKDVEVGEMLPDATGGISSFMNYKGITLNLAFDYQIGGQIYSLSNRYGIYGGTHEETVFKNRNGVWNRYPVAEGGGQLIKGVNEDGTPIEFWMEALDYATMIQADRTEFVYDASFFKLRELSLGYNFPQKWIKPISMRHLSLSFVVTNPSWFFFAESEIDPTQQQENFFESGAFPSQESYGFNLKFGF
ncbi:SusC/RagA family TonB-linked outer membrane protein (plasmid) [Fulvitalea axinellae]|uniref:SusC/RagA family TonB-linked outer membrane protein n=1 Tax=Fulvitalea axinellae TaxID=1182444 RepID=A0AAU9DF24_9BACT|nr:SusC/RagA family TonB-linked outer membrane protein [Fulvitalea axinellae]